MPGTLTVRPIQANLTHNKDFLLNKQDPYCEILLGGQKVKTSTSHHGGKHPQWNDSFTLHSNNEPILYINLKDKDHFSHDDNIGVAQIDLKNVSSIPHGPQWYPVTGSHGSEGEILIDISYNPGMQAFPGQMPTMMPMTQPMGYPVTQPTMGYPTQAYPQQQMYPPQQQMYPTQQQVYPTQQQVYPTQQQVYPTQYPQQQYPPNTMGGYGGNPYYKY
jgi:hypothetical protein